MSGAGKHTDGIRRWWRPGRRHPPTHTATADTAQGARTHAHLPGPPAEIHTARHATDTWGAPLDQGASEASG